MKKEKVKRGIKYQILLWFLVILASVYIGMNFFADSTASADVPDDSVVVDPIDPEEPDAPGENDTSDTNNSGNEVVIPTDPIDLINYAINIYNNGKGSQSTFTYTVANRGVFQGVALSLNQYATGNLLRSGRNGLEETYLYYKDNEVSPIVKALVNQYGLLQNQYRAVNVDASANKVNYVYTNNYNRAAQTYDLTSGTRGADEFTVEKGKNRFIAIYCMEFPLEISNNTVKVTNYNTKKDKTYNYVTVSYKINKLPENFKYYYCSNSELSIATYQDYKLTFVINKRTGKLRRIIRDEEFTSPGLKGAITVYSKTRFQQDFSAMDKEINLRKPYLSYVATPEEA